MANDNNNLDINIDVNASKAEQGSTRAKKAIGSIANESRELQRAFKAIKSAIDPTFAAQDKYNQSLDQYKKLLDRGLVSQKEYRAGIRAAKKDLQDQIAVIERGSAVNKAAAAEKARVDRQAAENSERLAKEEAAAAKRASQEKIAAAQEERRVKQALEAREQRAIRLAAQMARQAASEANRSVRRGGATQRGIDPGSIQTQQSLAQLEASYKRTYEASVNHARKASTAAAEAAVASNAKQAASAQSRAEREKAIANDYATKAIGIARTIASVEGNTRQERVAAEKAARAQEKAAAKEAAHIVAQSARAKHDAERLATKASKEAADAINREAKAERAAAEAAQQLRASIDPVYAAQQRYNATMRTATQLLMQNKLRTGEFTQIQKNAKIQMELNQRSMGRMNAVNVQLGYQMQDVVASFKSGISPLTILAQQGGQTASAMSMMGGKVGAVASKLAGPWGAAIIGFTLVLGFLWDSLREGESATKDVMRAEDRRRMSVKELTQALEEYVRQQDAANKSALGGKVAQTQAMADAERKAIDDYNKAVEASEAANKRLREAQSNPGDKGTTGSELSSLATQAYLAEQRVKSLEKAYLKALEASVIAAGAEAQFRSDKTATELAEMDELDKAYDRYYSKAMKAGDNEKERLKLANRYQEEASAILAKYTKLKDKEAEARRKNEEAVKSETKAIFTSREQAIQTLGNRLIKEGYSPEMENFGVGNRKVGEHPGMGREAHGKYAIDLNIPGAGVEADNPIYREQMEAEVRAAQAAGYRILWNGKIYEPYGGGAILADIPIKTNQHKDHAHIEAPKGIEGKPAGTSLASSLGSAQMRAIQEEHNALIASLEFKQELAGEDLETVIRLQDEKIEAIIAFNGVDSAQAAEAAKQKIRYERLAAKEQLEIKRQVNSQILAREEQRLDQEQSLQQQFYATQSQAIDFALANNYISQEEAFRRKAILLDAEYQSTLANEQRIHGIKTKYLDDELLEKGLLPSEIRAINEKIQKEVLDHEQRVFEIKQSFGNETSKLQFDIMDKMEEKWRSLGQTIEQSLSSSFQGIWTHSQTFFGAMISLADQMIYQAFINPMAEVVSDWIVKQAKMLFIKKSTDAAVTASAIASETIQSGVASQGAISQTAVSAAAATGEITNNAAVAAAGAYKSTVVIPFIGPVSAPAAAALALAAVLGFGALISARGGQGEVTEDGQLTQLHKKEMVLPAWIAEPLRKNLRTPTSSGLLATAADSALALRQQVNNREGDVNFHYGPQNNYQNMNAEQMLRRDASVFRRWIKNEFRNGNIRLGR